MRLEVEKLRRAEGDWLQVLVRILDHTFALHQGAQRAGQQNVVAQLSHFQSVCLDAARRVGLVPFAARAGDSFDPQRHQSIEEKAPADASVEETVAPGYSFQGKLIRPALVRLRGSSQGAAAVEAGAATAQPPGASQNQLPLEQAAQPQPTEA